MTESWSFLRRWRFSSEGAKGCHSNQFTSADHCRTTIARKPADVTYLCMSLLFSSRQVSTTEVRMASASREGVAVTGKGRRLGQVLEAVPRKRFDCATGPLSGRTVLQGLTNGSKPCSNGPI
jgi:hypothetical protein